MIGELFLITCLGTFRSQQIVNTFTYKQSLSGSEVPIKSQSLALAFDLAFMTAGAGFRGGSISNLATFHSIRVQSLFTPADYYEQSYDPPLGGGAASAAEPNFSAYGFRTQWLGGVVRRGFKRIAGVLTSVTPNGQLDAATMTNLGLFAAAMTDTLVNEDDSFRPCIVKRIKEVDPDTGEVTYRLPENIGEAVAVTDIVWSVMPLVTTQSTRKIGRGS